MANLETLQAPSVASMFEGRTFEQPFSRAMMTKLWSVRKTLDPGQVKILDRFYNKASRHVQTPRTEVTYERKGTPGRLGFGRWYSNCGLEIMDVNIRATLCRDILTDIDMVNAHPTIAVQFARRYFGKDMTSLAMYVENRAMYLEEFQKLNDWSAAEAKTMVSLAIYNGYLPDDAHPILKGIRQEMHELYKHARLQPVYHDLYIACTQDKRDNELFNPDGLKSESNVRGYLMRSRKINVEGSLLAQILQTEEARILEAAVEAMDHAGYTVNVLAYDGLMAEIPACNHDDAITRIVESVKAKTGYAVIFKIKQMPPALTDDELGVSEDPKERIERQYRAMKIEFERSHYYFEGADCVVRSNPDGTYQNFSIKHCANAFTTWHIEDDKVGFFRRWIKDPQRRTIIRKVAKMPADCGDDEVSIFHGFAADNLGPFEASETEGAVDTFCDLARAILGDNDTQYQYGMQYFAHMIQKPLERPNVCMILTSLQHGVGKDTLLGILAAIVGRGHTSHWTSDEQFWSPYDTGRDGCVLGWMEEVGVGANVKYSAALKALITAIDTSINPKGMTAYIAANIARLIMTTNEVCPVKLEEYDRRFWIVKASDRLKRTWSSDKWLHVLEQFKRPAWIWAIYQFLKSYDISTFVASRFPVSEIREELIALVKEANVEKEFMEQWTGTDVTAAEMYTQYVAWCRRDPANPLRYKPSVLSFVKSIMVMSINGLTKRVGHSNKSFYTKSVVNE